MDLSEDDYIHPNELNELAMLYLVIHIFIIFALNNITSSLEFMREEDIALTPKMLFLVISVVLYFTFLFALKGYVKNKTSINSRFILKLVGATVLFVVLMMLLREQMIVNILLTVVYVFAVFVVIHIAGKRTVSIEEKIQFRD